MVEGRELAEHGRSSSDRYWQGRMRDKDRQIKADSDGHAQHVRAKDDADDSFIEDNVADANTATKNAFQCNDCGLTYDSNNMLHYHLRNNLCPGPIRRI